MKPRRFSLSRWISLVASCLVLAASSCAITQQVVVYRVSGETSPVIEIDVGARALLELQSHAGTGYEWQLAVTEDNGASLVTVGRATTRAIAPGVIGGAQVWTFPVEGKRAGNGLLHFELVRPWEKETPPAQRVTIPFRVDSKE
ncbi:MAG: protease inhibitor I42 family protein [Planctomycetota bacterium]|nr:protease inhibitor I42 family protein [Planctomycetota bacterium]